MPSNSRTRAVAALAVLLVVACSTAAPELPTDTTAVNRTAEISLGDFKAEDVKLSCGEILAESIQIKNRMAEADSAIQANRSNNQAAGYVGMVFLFPALGLMKTNEDEKLLLANSQARRDTLTKLAYAKGCPPSE